MRAALCLVLALAACGVDGPPVPPALAEGPAVNAAETLGAGSGGV